ncbi:hypothetical protein TWF173_003629 [Orbilia oligospora]|uniref:PQ-loop-domain-containing protein n=3 Tax=Orbilia oligospora TaxID=2813651 RepID=G1X5R3_ARTOA|nr:hypothetical protein AOL_s00054g207 [Orbilia oligospora ATCC 24927]EGX51508.1 hypothetical protein AOL_s00054g207 [Orbilia oligospora ATCC 24927]KAF3281490.1 hypothetical protein TWF970_002050 [Orbilia oligospora]KAF3319179.1 hypothetical protein TWF173_003629 [Orbilia oligospora]
MFMPNNHFDTPPAGDGYTSATYPPSQSISLSIEAISGITGSVSIACWLVVFTPQIVENFKRGSAEGLSLTFLILWLLGDIFNVLGGILQGVIPTMLILAIYYTFADIVLLIQCFYYRAYAQKPLQESPVTNGHHHEPARPGTAGSEHDPTEESPLLSRTISDFYGEERRGSLSILADQAHHLSPANPLHSLPPSRPESIHKIYTNGEYPIGGSSTGDLDGTGASRGQQARNGNKFWKSVLRDAIAVSLVIFAGIAGYYLTPSNGNTKDPHIPEHKPLEFSFYGQIFGYLCAVLYLGSRIPQIVLNYQRKSCEGVAFLFFLFACLGNVTYVISILAYKPGRVEDGEGYWRYVAVNASWLLGSLGTLGLDFVIFVQFFMYRADEYGDDSAIMSDSDEERPIDDDEATIRPSS